MLAVSSVLATQLWQWSSAEAISSQLRWQCT